MAADSKSSPSAGSRRGKSRLLLAALLLCLAPAALDAQEAGVSMKIDVVAWGDDIGGLSFKSGQREGNITAKAFTYSDPVNYSGPRIMEIHQTGSGAIEKVKGPGTAEDEMHESIPLPAEELKKTEAVPQTPLARELLKRRQKEPTLVALVALPSNARRATVLLAPSAAGTYQAYVINDDPSTLPLGKLRVHNLSPYTIAMQFSGAQKKEMQPRETFIVSAPRGHTVYRLAYKDGEEWTVQENNIIPVRPDEQTQLIVLKSRNQFFLSADGASGGFLQMVTLRRTGQGT